MIKTILMFVIVSLLVGISFFIYTSPNTITVSVGEEKVFSGPVRPTDDESYFRKTGITMEEDK